jgi:hypothetical protein
MAVYDRRSMLSGQPYSAKQNYKHGEECIDVIDRHVCSGPKKRYAENLARCRRYDDRVSTPLKSCRQARVCVAAVALAGTASAQAFAAYEIR